jgi:hypothetical protein
MSEPPEAYASIATVDEVHIEVIREVLADAGITVRVRALAPPEGLQIPQLVVRRRVEVLVDAAREGEARALMQSFEESGEAAANEQAEAAAPATAAAAPESLWRRGWRWIVGRPAPGPDPDQAGDDGPHP